MKFIGFIFLSTLLFNRHKGLPPINYSCVDIPIKEVFAEMNNQTNVVFFYDVGILKEIKPITIDLRNLSFEAALDQILLDQPVKWAMEDKTVTIYKD
jgi:TonB-dependent starch-binding outer membrane protein SusC